MRIARLASQPQFEAARRLFQIAARGWFLVERAASLQDVMLLTESDMNPIGVFAIEHSLGAL